MSFSKLLLLGAIDMSIGDAFAIVNSEVSNISENKSRDGT